MQEWIRTVLKTRLWLHEQDIPLFGSPCYSSNTGTALQGPGRGSADIRTMPSSGDTWTLSLPTSQPSSHTVDSGQSSWPPYAAIRASHLQCKLEMWIAPLVQSSCALTKDHWVKIHPETNTYSQLSVGTVPELERKWGKGAGISGSRRDGFTPILCQQSCQFFMQMVLFSAKILKPSSHLIFQQDFKSLKSAPSFGNISYLPEINWKDNFGLSKEQFNPN